MSTLWSQSVTDLVTIPDHVDLKMDQLMAYRPFKDWWTTVSASMDLQRNDRTHRFHDRAQRYSLKSIVIQSVDWWGSRIGFLKMNTIFTSEANPKGLPGTIFMRGGSVAVLIVISPDDDEDERWVIMTQQPRIPAGSFRFYEIPAGMLDDTPTLQGAAAKEILEETGLTVPKHELINMTELALKGAQSAETHLRRAMYPSPGGSDEFIALYLWEKTMHRMEIEELKDRLAGVEGEFITVKLVPYQELWREGARDAKTLGAWALYEGLSRSGDLHNV